MADQVPDYLVTYLKKNIYIYLFFLKLNLSLLSTFKTNLKIVVHCSPTEPNPLPLILLNLTLCSIDWDTGWVYQVLLCSGSFHIYLNDPLVFFQFSYPWCATRFDFRGLYHFCYISSLFRTW